MIVTEKPLFDGTNEGYWDLYTKETSLFLPKFWTTSPTDAMIHANNSVKRHGSRKLVVCLKIWDSSDFEVYGKGGFGPEPDTRWYEMIEMPNSRGIITPKLVKEKFLEIYRESDLDKLVEKYCDENQKRFYEGLKQGWGK